MEKIETETGSATAMNSYSPLARAYHWWSAAIVATMWLLGHVMGDDDWLHLSEGTRGQLSNVHKLLGFLFLWLVVARLYYRVRKGAPPSEQTLELWHKAASHLTHWALYILILAMPLSGWIGVSLYGARDIWGPIALPQITGINEKLSDTVFHFHALAANALLLLVLAHVGAALYHHFIRRDQVLARMLPQARGHQTQPSS
jgi:cytochrome b561